MSFDDVPAFIASKLEEIEGYITKIDSLSDKDPKFNTHCETLVNKFKTGIDVFQEGPHLMDGRLHVMLANLTDCVLRHADSDSKVDLSFSLAYLITKARGYKVVIRHLPHEVKHMSLVLKMISRQNPSDCRNWETKYMLLLWLSILCLIPLDMKRFDTGDGSVTVAQRIYDVIKTYLQVNGKHQDAAPFLAAKFLTRPEIQAMFLSDFVDWSLQVVEGTDLKNVKSFKETGVLAALYYLFKIGKREITSPFGDRMLEAIKKHQLMKSSDNKLVKYVLKLTQRIGLSFLRMKDVSWRYKRGQRILSGTSHLARLPAGGDIIVASECLSEAAPDDDDDFEVPAELEDIIDCMINGLRKESSISRWSAAKGIGRLTARLPKEMAEAVVEAILDLFSRSEEGSAWHGGCLCLAELGRRGLILPSQLPRVLEVVKKAVVFDECKGCFSIGSNVRDAACYVCWSFARAYDAATLKPLVADLASSLLVVAIFDREVNCRRAAAAAFQENVGRQGVFPDGIEIITVIDYQSVGSRANSFIQLSSFLSQFEAYQEPMIRHLMAHKISHWDPEIRELAAQALYKIACIVPVTLVNHLAVPELMKQSLASDGNSRHGALMSLGSLAKAIHGRREQLEPQLIDHLWRLVTIYNSAKYLQGFGSEHAKQGFCHLIECCALSSFPVDPATADSWMHVILETIFNSKLNQQTMDSGIRCLPVFAKEYLKGDERRIDNLLDTLTEKLRSQEEGIRCSSFSVVHQMPIELLSDANRATILNILINSITSGKQSDVQMAEARAAGILSLSAFLTKLPDESLKSLSSLLREQVYRRCLVRGLKDYTTGFKGDIGISVRRNSLKALEEITLHLLGKESKADILSSDDLLIHEMMSAIITLCVANQEQLRCLASGVFLTLLHQLNLNLIPHRDELIAMFPVASLEPVEDADLEYKSTDLATERLALESFVQLLPLQSYTRSLWEGLVTSIGGMTVSVAKSARESVSRTLRMCRSSKPSDVYVCIFDELFRVFSDGIACPRLAIPLLNTYVFLMTSGHMDGIDGETDHIKSILKTTWNHISKSGDPVKKITGGSLICSALRFKGCTRMTLNYVAVLLCSPSSPRVRLAVAELLNVSILTFSEYIFLTTGDARHDNEHQEEGVGDSCERCLDLLTATDWSKPVAELKPIRDQLCSLLGIKSPSHPSS